MFRYFKVAFVFSLTLILLTSCSSKKTPTSISKEPETSPKLETNIGDYNAKYYLDEAKKAESSAASISYLVQASNLLLHEEKFTQALWLADQTTALLNASIWNTLDKYALEYQLAITKGIALFVLEDFERASAKFEYADKLSTEYNIQHKLNYYYYVGLIEEQKGNAIDQASALLYAFELDDNTSEEDVWRIWSLLNSLPKWQIEQLKSVNPPNYEGWMKLISYSNKYGVTHVEFVKRLNNWQSFYPNHPAQSIIPLIIEENNVTTPVIENVVVLLPLSGKQKRAGEVTQQGILSAYNNSPEKKLHFFDSATLDYSTLTAKLSVLQADYVIGPLLKQNVDKFLSTPDIVTPTLLLNLPSTSINDANITAFSMRPEDEAIQAATTLSAKNYKYPIVLSHKDPVSQRISNMFTRQWEGLTGITPKTIHFQRGDKMQNEIKTSLEVNLSQDRINSLNRRIKETIKTETRNRRDIDMIYIVGSPIESQLIKPYIDVNTSPFAEIIPVFASSRSNKGTNNAGDSRDLNGLIFSDIPWLLPTEQQNKPLSVQAQKLWPARSVGLERIFAMGYDSYELIEKIPSMEKLPYIRHYGQTGVLQRNNNGVISRSLQWGKYTRDKVTAFDMD